MPRRLLPTLVAIAVVLVAAPAVTARVLVPVDALGLLGSIDEYANVGFVEDGTKANQNSWGRGIEAAVEVHNTCNRADKHALSSWVGVDVFDSTTASATFTSFHQMGWDQNWADQGCGEARAFGQTCYSPCASKNDYLLPEFFSTLNVPDDGLPGHFRMVVTNIGGGGPSSPCIVRMEAGLQCPMVMTSSELRESSCEGAQYMAEVEMECDLSASELQFLAGQAEACQTLEGVVLAQFGQFCQAAAAAQAIRDQAVPWCEGALSPLDPVFDAPICLRDSNAGASFSDLQTGCKVEFYHDKVLMTPKAPQLSDCAVAKDARVEYEAADDFGFAHTGPGSSDQPSQYTQWSYIGNTGTSLIDGASINDGTPTNDNFYLGHSATCPTYEGRYRTSSSLVNFVEIGPHIDGNTNWCGQEDTAATPGPGLLFVLAALALAAFAGLRPRGRRTS